MKEPVDRTEVLEKLNELPLPSLAPNRGYDPRDLISSFWVCVGLGVARFAHTVPIRFDKVLKKSFEGYRVPLVGAYTRFSGRFTREYFNNVFPGLNRWFFRKMLTRARPVRLKRTI